MECNEGLNNFFFRSKKFSSIRRKKQKQNKSRKTYKNCDHIQLNRNRFAVFGWWWVYFQCRLRWHEYSNGLFMFFYLLLLVSYSVTVRRIGVDRLAHFTFHITRADFLKLKMLRLATKTGENLKTSDFSRKQAN